MGYRIYHISQCKPGAHKHCNGAPYGKVIFFKDTMNYKDAEHYCKIHKGYLYTPESKLRNDWMVGMTLKFNKTCEQDSWINRSPNLDKRMESGSEKTF